jgi:LacI family transcriptional regulator
MQARSTHKKVTINDVADLAGVSAMTVSRVIRNKGNISPETRAQVKRIINELKYEPLSSARNLSGAFSRTISIVIPDFKELRQLRHGYEYEYALLVGALNICKVFDYAVNIVEIRVPEDVNLLVKRVLNRQVGGYIVAAPTTEYADLLKTLQEHELVFSTISAYSSEHSDLVVVANERQATRDMAQQMLDLGHRRIAFVGGVDNQRATTERQAGFLDAINNHTDPSSIAFSIHNCNPFFEDGYRTGLYLLSNAERPSAIQCLTDDIAAGVISAANKLSIRLPAELSICGFDNFGLARKISPALTTAVLPAEEMAEVATLQIIEALEGKCKKAMSALNCEVITRESVASVAKHR